jgi:hypothetical protein
MEDAERLLPLRSPTDGRKWVESRQSAVPGGATEADIDQTGGAGDYWARAAAARKRPTGPGGAP